MAGRPVAWNERNQNGFSFAMPTNPSPSCSKTTARCRTIRRCQCSSTKAHRSGANVRPGSRNRKLLHRQWLGSRPMAQRHLSLRTLPFDDLRSARHRAGPRQVQLGGHHGEVFDLAAGDVVVLPAGTGHQRLQPATIFLSSALIRPRAPITSAAATTRRIATRRSHTIAKVSAARQRPGPRQKWTPAEALAALAQHAR